MKLVIASSSRHQLKNQTTQPKSHAIPTKSPFSNNPHQKPQYRTQYRKTPQKSTLSPISHPKSKPTIKTTFFLYKYKNLKKIHISPITNFSTNLPTNPHQNSHQIFHISHLTIIISYYLYQTFLTTNH